MLFPKEYKRPAFDTEGMHARFIWRHKSVSILCGPSVPFGEMEVYNSHGETRRFEIEENMWKYVEEYLEIKVYRVKLM